MQHRLPAQRTARRRADRERGARGRVLLGLDAQRDDDARHHVVRRDRADQLDQLAIVADGAGAARRSEGRVGHLDRARHLERKVNRRALGRIEQRRRGEGAIDVGERVDLRLARAGGAQKRRVVKELVGRAVDRRHDADRDLAQAGGQLEPGPHRAHQRVPAERERRAVEQLAVEVQQRAAAPGANRRDDLLRAGVVVRLVGQAGHGDPARAIAVIGCNQESLDLAIELLLWSKDLVLCTNGPLKVERKAVETIKRLCIRIIETPIALLEGAGDKLEGIRFTDSSFLPRSAVFFSPGQYQRSPLAEQLGCEFCEENNCIQCGEDTATNIPGVYAAGNASRGVQLVIAAAAEGMQAAFAINSALLDADAGSNALRDHEPGQPTPSHRITPGSNEAVD